MRVSEDDASLVLVTARVLGVELEPWQEQVLQWLLADHRQKPADNADWVSPDLCCHVLRCLRPRGHDDAHSTEWPSSLGSIRWFDDT